MGIVNFDDNNISMLSSHAYGKKIAKEALLFGILALCSLVFFLGAIPIALVLGMFAVGKAKEAQRVGVDAFTAQVMGRIAIVISSVSFILMSTFVFVSLYSLQG